MRQHNFYQVSKDNAPSSDSKSKSKSKSKSDDTTPERVSGNETNLMCRRH